MKHVSWTVAIAAALVMGTLLCATPAFEKTAEARGGAAAPAQPAQDATYVNGDRYFRQAIQYVANGHDVIHQVVNFFAELEDVKMNWDDSKHEGHMRLWFANPDKYRFEMRPRRVSKDATTKLLVGNDKMWVMSPQGVQAMHKTPEGARAIAQARQDRQRLSDISRFLTLAGLLGKDVRFAFRGRKRGSGTFAGEWLQVDRIAPDGSIIAFFFAYERNAKGEIVRATYPGVVTVVGDPTKGEPTEHFILADWRAGELFRFPGKISAYAKRGAGPSKQFMMAFPKAIQINAQMPASVFQPPK